MNRNPYQRKRPYKKRVYKHRFSRGRLIHRKTPHSHYTSQELVIYRGQNLMPYPPRFRTKFQTDIYGYIAAASTTVNQYYCGMNYIHLPYNNGGWSNAVPAIATLTPTGYSALLNANIYTKARVFFSKILVEFLPQALGDTLEVTVTPSNATGSPTNTGVAMAQPNTKSGLFSSSKNNVNSKKHGSAIVNAISQHKLIGVSAQALANDLSGNYEHAYNANPTIPLYWVVNTTAPDAAATPNFTNPCEFRIRLTHWVELYAAYNASVPES